MGDYFELFKKNTDRLEDLFLQLLDILKLDPPEQTQFNQIHYHSYTKFVIKNPHLDKIIKEGAKYKQSEYSSDVLIDSLNNIDEIIKES